MLANGRETVAASDNDARDKSSRHKHHWSVTSAWRYALATIAALEKERRLPKRRRTLLKRILETAPAELDAHSWHKRFGSRNYPFSIRECSYMVRMILAIDRRFFSSRWASAAAPAAARDRRTDAANPRARHGRAQQKAH